jgi:tRNA threonylcarbamoyladenosine biosynthesis protein TsaB
MRILAFDTSTHTASVAVLNESGPLAEINASVEARHGETLLPRIQAVLEEAGMPFASIDLLAVGIGPGSFTGVRVGLATAKGLTLATGKPLRGVVSLRTLARGAPATREMLAAPVMDAYKGEVYLAAYERGPSGELWERLEPMHAPPAEAALALRQAASGSRVLMCGSGAHRYAQIFADRLGDGALMADPALDLPRAVHLGHEARLAFEREGASDLFALEPLYLRPSDARLPADAE